MEFFKSESPYRKANKGWINQDIFLDLSPSSDTFQQKNEDAKVTFFWSPINILLSNIFLIIIIGSILVFTSLSVVKGRFNINLLNNSMIENIGSVEVNKVSSINELGTKDTMKEETNLKLNLNETDKYNKIKISDKNTIDIDQKNKNNKIDEKNNLIEDVVTSKNIENVKIKKSKSNFF